MPVSLLNLPLGCPNVCLTGMEGADGKSLTYSPSSLLMIDTLFYAYYSQFEKGSFGNRKQCYNLRFFQNIVVTNLEKISELMVHQRQIAEAPDV